MPDMIMDLVAWAIIINAFASIYVFAVSKLLPSFLFAASYKKHGITDRGLKKYTFPNGRGILYEPDIKYRDFLKRYIIFEYNGKKYIKCKLSEKVVSLRYEVAVYNNKDRLIKVIELSENVPNKCETKNVELPKDTSYVSVILKRVNEAYRFDTLRCFSAKRVAIFSAITAAMTVIYGIMIRKLILYVDALLNSDLTISLASNVISSLVVSVIVIILCINICRKRIFGKE